MCAFLWLTPTRTPPYTSTWAQSLCPQLPLLSWILSLLLMTTCSSLNFVNFLRESLALGTYLCHPQTLSCPPRTGSMTDQLL